MAAVTAANKTAYGFSTPGGPQLVPNYSGGAVVMMQCFFACTFSGTYVQGTGFTLSWASDIAATISANKRDGGTITVWDVCSVAGGLEGATNAIILPGVTAYSAGATTGLLYGPDGATEHAAAAMGTQGRSCVFCVTFLDSSPGA